MNAATASSQRQQLLTKAARCYRDAGQDRDACRCLEQAGAFGTAAALHQLAERWSQAALCYEHAQQWAQAALCFLNADQPLPAARCYLAAANPLEAAWILAHRAHRPQQARALLENFQPQDPQQQLAHLLASARALLPSNSRQAARLLRQVIPRLGELPEGEGRNRVMNWAFDLSSQALDRPDLTIELLSSAWLVGIDTRNQGEQWARQRLHSPEVFTHLSESSPEFTQASAPTNAEKEHQPT